MEYVNIETTQNIDLEYKIASIGDRIFAFAIDFFTMILWVIIWLTILTRMGSLEYWQIIFALPVVFYSLLCEILLNGQSFGKMVMKIRVVKMDGSELSLGSCLLRWLFRIIDVLFLGGAVAIISIIASNKAQRIGDIVAGTLVVKLTNNNFLEDTSYVEVPAEYVPKYDSVYLLSDEDVQTIKEVLDLSGRSGAGSVFKTKTEHTLMLKTREAIQKKLNIDKLDIPSIEFLENVLKDYNHIHQ